MNNGCVMNLQKTQILLFLIRFFIEISAETLQKQKYSNYVMIIRTVLTWFSINLGYTNFVTIE